MGGVGLKNIPYFDEDDKSPLYHKIQNHILGRIESGEFEVGDMLPPEPELAEYYGVSRITVKRALLELSNEGIIVRKQGKGTFVAAPKLEEDISKVVALAQPVLMHPGRSWHKVLSVKTEKADSEVAKALDIEAGTPVVRIERLKIVDEQPYIYELSYVSEDLCPDLERKFLDWKTKLIYEILQSEYSLQLSRTKMTIEPTILNLLEARLLDSHEGAPAMLWRRVTFTNEGKPAEFYKAVVRGDRFKYYLEFPPKFR
jgi:GntR family transcriptional regulator